MTRAEAVQRLKKLGLIGYVGKGVTSPDRRAEAKIRHDTALADAQDLQRRIEAQFGAEHQAITRRLSQTDDEMRAYKFQVYLKGTFEIQKAKGDTWEEVFAALDAKALPEPRKVGA